MPLEVVVARLERALGATGTAQLRRQLDFWRTTQNEAAMEEWRQRQVARMFSLSEFVKRLKFRFTRWYNRKHRRKGVLWESRYTSVIVEEEQRALAHDGGESAGPARTGADHWANGLAEEVFSWQFSVFRRGADSGGTEALGG